VAPQFGEARVTPPLHRRVLMHVCTHDACDAVEVDGSCNHSQYMCYRHSLPQPMRPLYFISDAIQPSDDEARAIRERATHGLWRRPSEHFGPDGRFVDAAADEDWLGWPSETVPSEQQPLWQDDMDRAS
jgi:hypothetical protein